MKIPKGFTIHEAVTFVETKDTNGSDSKYIVHIKDGYHFTAGHAEGCSGSVGVDSVQEFLQCRPVRRVSTTALYSAPCSLLCSVGSL